MSAADTPPFLRMLLQATNSHDLDALVTCFAPAYRNEAPAHPSRNFDGREQVRANWARIFAFVPDVRAKVVRWAANFADIWSEWEMSGTRLDGTAHLMRGVIIFEVRDDRATSARFYLEPVADGSTDGVDDAVSRQVHADSATLIAT
jgi:limonene-1,2-epoxide hydrolase